MVFSSPTFLFGFLPLLLALVALTPRALRNALLFLASFLFYAWGEPAIAIVILVSIAANWAFGLGVARSRSPRERKAIVVVACAFNLGLIAFFKYAHFAWANLGAALSALGLSSGAWPALEPIPLPIGISFFTFQAMSYVIDVYRGDGEAQKNPVDFGLYKTFFPVLIAGPIVRYKDIAEQVRTRRVTLPGFGYGVQRFILGLGKKVLVANVVAEQADRIFALDSADLTAPVAWLGTLCYTLQIYFDFSGYSDMAIGLGHLFGFRILENFRHPYVAGTITDFWRRWHISLSTWFRDYLYIPLGGSRRGRARTYLNLLIVFFLCGLWHGAAWNYVVWGLYHGLFLVLERVAFDDPARKRGGVLGHAYVLLVVMVGWVFFRCHGDLPRAVQHLQAMAGLGAGDGIRVHTSVFLDPLVWTAIAAGAIGSVPWLPALARWRASAAVRPDRSALRPLLEGATLVLLLATFLASALVLSADTYNPFIYFRF